MGRILFHRRRRGDPSSPPHPLPLTSSSAALSALRSISNPLVGPVEEDDYSLLLYLSLSYPGARWWWFFWPERWDIWLTLPRPANGCGRSRGRIGSSLYRFDGFLSSWSTGCQACARCGGAFDRLNRCARSRCSGGCTLGEQHLCFVGTHAVLVPHPTEEFR